ncbi:MAG TPA: protein translocase subunit SecD [Bacillota bacterium]|nr:protein translocase subunit SecD [Bacillota bacterium]
MKLGNARACSRFVLVLLVIILAAAVALCGFEPLSIPSVAESGGITLGLDLSGGSIIVYEAQTDLSGSELSASMNAVEALMRQRLDNLGYTEAVVSLQGTKQVRIEIPSVTDPEEAVQKIGTTAKLVFRNKDGKTIIDGEHIVSATAYYGQINDDNTSGYYVALKLTDEGQKLFTAGTKASAGSYIEIVLDDEVMSSPTVSKEFASTGITQNPIITIGDDAEQAIWLASIITAGQLPFDLVDVELRSVGATLGDNSLSTSLLAGVIGLVLVILFMIIVYRLPGVVASISLTAYTVIVVVLLALLKVNLTLPGIAGVILSIGMAVDANVVIFERIKEELRTGKSVKAAIKAGFDRAFSAVLDANVTTLIAAVVLWIFGTGTIQGFAKTLTIGVAVSFLTAITLTKLLLNLTAQMNQNKLWLYGVKLDDGTKEKKKIKFNFVKNSKVTLIIVCCVVLVGVLSFAIRGFNIDIDFEGGTEFIVAVGQDFKEDDIRNLVDDLFDEDVVSSVRSSGADGTEVVIQTKQLDSKQRELVFNALSDEYGLTESDLLSVDNVGASVGSALTKTAIISSILAVVLMLIYISVRFAFLSGLSAIVCLVHDLFVMMTVYSLFQIPMGTTVIAAMLTILGYSINATIIVFDRIRDNRRLHGTAMSFDDVVDVSAKQTVRRSIYTTITTLFTIGMIYILGVESIKEFALPLMIGFCAGLFSSVFLSGLIWDKLYKRFGDFSLLSLFKKKKKAKAEKA